MSKILTIPQARAKLAEMGVEIPAYATSQQVRVTLHEELKRRASAAKLPTVATTIKATIPTVSDLKAAIAKEKNASKRIDMLESLESNLLTALEAVKTDAVKGTAIRTELQRVQKSAAYARLAEATENPAAAKARRYMEFSDLD